MAIHPRTSPNIAHVLAEALSEPDGLVRHDLPEGVSIWFLFDGNADRPRTRQWRVTAPTAAMVRRVVSDLRARLAENGIETNEARFGDCLARFEERKAG